jgi:hypothetical protein
MTSICNGVWRKSNSNTVIDYSAPPVVKWVYQYTKKKKKERKNERKEKKKKRKIRKHETGRTCEALR